jgi:hypothetical protein
MRGVGGIPDTTGALDRIRVDCCIRGAGGVAKGTVVNADDTKTDCWTKGGGGAAEVPAGLAELDVVTCLASSSRTSFGCQ